MEKSGQTKITSMGLLLGGLYGLLGLITNTWFIIPLYGNLSLHLGEVFVITCLITRGISPAILASLLATSGLVFHTGNYVFYISALLELFVLSFFLRKGVLLLLADGIFWLIIGIPITYVTIIYIYDVTSTDFIQVILLKQAVNGVLVVSIVALLKPFIPSKWFSPWVYSDVPKLSDRVFELALNSISLPALIISLFLSDSSADNTEKQMESVLKIRTEHYSSYLNNYVDYHLNSLRSLESVVLKNELSENKRDALLNEWNKIYSGFITMIVANQNGLIISGSPEEFYKKLKVEPEEKRTIVDRDYFKIPKAELVEYVSKVFRGRGFGDEPIVAISVPIIDDKRNFLGIVEGSLNIPKLEYVEKSMPVSDGHIIIKDQNKNIIYSSPELDLETLEHFEVVDISPTFTNRMKVFALKGNQYLYHSELTDYGWRVIALAEPSLLIGSYGDNFLRLSVILLFIAVLSLAVTRRFSKQITKPLESLVKNFAAHRPIQNPPNNIQTSIEIESVREQLKEVQYLTLEYQESLKKEVEIKTAELMKMNEQLQKMSVEDELTKVFNRRGFEKAVYEIFKLACRNKTPITFAIIDVDHFKVVNDTWGHSVGDDCLVMIAKELKEHFQRETDFVARYGGEEFVVFLSGGNIDKHCRMLEEFRKKIAGRKVPVKGESVSLTISIGVYSLENNFNIGYHNLVSKADELLYRSKNNGRNQITCGGQ
ncbi:diguanylate cyclase [Kangiella sp.]|uniref:diguanylate cyclase n=1 Tax=Kangiella sp. TaxID=1920245 RepID=UPI003A937495